MHFEPAFIPPTTQSARALWFIFCRDRLLLKAGDNGCCIPSNGDLTQIKLVPNHPQYLGALDGRQCFAAELPDEAQIADGLI